MSLHFNGLTPAEAERLALVAEECGEVIQAITKILRHGYESCYPDSGLTNRAHMTNEMGDLHAVVNLMVDAGDVDVAEIDTAMRDKLKRLPKWLHHQDAAQGELP